MSKCVKVCLFYDYNAGKYKQRRDLANIGDPDQTAPKEQSDQGLHCLLFFLNVLAQTFFLKSVGYLPKLVKLSQHFG